MKILGLALIAATLSFAQNRNVPNNIIVPASGSILTDFVISTDPTAGASCPAYQQRYWDYLTGHTWGCVGAPGSQIWTDLTAGGSSLTLPAAGSLAKVGPGGTTLIAAVANTDYLTSSSSVVTTQLPSTIRGRTCEIHIWGDGTNGALQTSDSEVNSCFNDSAATLTITGVRCLADNSSSTTTITPILTGGGATSILTGALTCGNGTFAAGTLNGTPSLTAASTIDANITAIGTAKSLRIILTTTY